MYFLCLIISLPLKKLQTLYPHINKGAIMQDSIKEKIEKRAFHLFLKRGGVHGYAQQDWIQAEKEIAAELKTGKKVEIKPPAPVQKPVQKSTWKNDKKR
jgi:hypothetical protein